MELRSCFLSREVAVEVMLPYCRLHSREVAVEVLLPLGRLHSREPAVEEMLLWRRGAGAAGREEPARLPWLPLSSLAFWRPQGCLCQGVGPGGTL